MANRARHASLAVLCAGALAMPACGDDDPTPEDGSYAAFNLFTGAPRFAIFKADDARDLCVRVVFLWAGPEGTVDLDDAAPEASVTHRAADCAALAGGAPPSLEAPGVPAQDVTGTVTVTRYPDGDTDRWTVSIDGSIAFSPDEDWVPGAEPLEATELEIVGGCC